jgi:hypothetical protein
MAIIINAICLGGCIACTIYLKVAESKERD